MTVLDLERGEPIHFYDNCCFGTRDRLPLATDPLCPHLAVCSCANGKGLTLFDLRMPLPFDFVFDLHDNVIRDIVFLNQSWPFVSPHQCALATVSDDGTCKINTLDGRVLHCFDIGHVTNTLACSPGPFVMNEQSGFPSVMMLAGDQLSEYTPHSHSSQSNKFTLDSPPVQLPPSVQNLSRSSYASSSLYTSLQNMTNHININLNLHLQPFQSRAFHSNLSSAQSSMMNSPTLASFEPHRPRYPFASNLQPVSCNNCVTKSILLGASMTKMKYTSNGGMLYAACDNFTVKKIRRYPNEHRIVGTVLTHKSDICDLDISPFDEFLVTASKDKTVGVMYLGPPNHGWTSYCQLT